MPIELQILPPKKEDSCFMYRVKTAGVVQRGWLTYEVHPGKPEVRTLLLIKGSRDLLEGKQISEYNNLVSELKKEAPGRVRAAKNIVNRLAEGEISLPNVRVAIHRFGPVPVYVPPFELKTKFEGSEISVHLALYPSVGKPGRAGRAEFLPDQAEFLRSLKLETGRLLQRYLEDVGECFYDIEYHLDLTGTFERAKDAERLLAESIKSKLKACLPSRNSLSAYSRDRPLDPADRISCELFSEKTDLLLSARFARNVAMFFLNELYRLVGISSRSAEYLEVFKEIETEFDSRVREGYYKEAQETLDEVRTLRRVLQAYRREDHDDLNSVASDVGWVSRFVGFAQFIGGIRKFSEELQLTPEIARIFLSHQHDVPVAEVLREQIESWAKEGDQPTAKVLFFKSPPGPEIRSGIRRLIWLADSVNAVTPERPVPIYGGVEKGYAWIGIEAEHGLLLGKKLLFFVEEGADLQKIVRDFQEILPTDVLAPRASVPFGDRIDGLVRSLRDNVFANFDVRSLSSTHQAMDSRTLQALRGEAEAVVVRRTERLIRGLLGQLTPEARSTVARMQRMAPYPAKKPKSWFARKLVENHPKEYKDENAASRAVTNAWDQVKERSLLIRGEEYRPLRLESRRYYSGRLAEMAAGLLPSSRRDQVAAVVRRVLSAIDPDLDI